MKNLAVIPNIIDRFAGTHWGTYGTHQYPIKIYRCESDQGENGLVMVNVFDINDRANVPKKAIGCTFFEAEDRKKCWYVGRWGQMVDKTGAYVPMKLSA